MKTLTVRRWCGICGEFTESEMLPDSSEICGRWREHAELKWKFKLGGHGG